VQAWILLYLRSSYAKGEATHAEAREHPPVLPCWPVPPPRRWASPGAVASGWIPVWAFVGLSLSMRSWPAGHRLNSTRWCCRPDDLEILGARPYLPRTYAVLPRLTNLLSTSSLRSVRGADRHSSPATRSARGSGTQSRVPVPALSRGARCAANTIVVAPFAVESDRGVARRTDSFKEIMGLDPYCADPVVGTLPSSMFRSTPGTRSGLGGRSLPSWSHNLPTAWLAEWVDSGSHANRGTTGPGPAGWADGLGRCWC